MNGKRKCYSLTRLSETDGLSMVFVLIIIAIAISLFFASTSIAPFREKGYMYALKDDLNNARQAAKMYWIDHPEATIVSEEQLKSKGWSKSEDSIFVSADMTPQKGRIVLKSAYFAGRTQYASGMASISFDGTMLLPALK